MPSATIARRPFWANSSSPEGSQYANWSSLFSRWQPTSEAPASSIPGRIVIQPRHKVTCILPPLLHHDDKRERYSGIRSLSGDAPGPVHFKGRETGSAYSTDGNRL